MGRARVRVPVGPVPRSLDVEQRFFIVTAGPRAVRLRTGTTLQAASLSDHTFVIEVLVLFYFDVDDGEWVSHDSTGIELASAEAAAAEAQRALVEIARDKPQRRALQAVVRNEHRQPLFRATLAVNGEWLA
jgi:hypothetical protein